MPKTSNLRSELLDIRSGKIDVSLPREDSFMFTVAVWEAPGSKDSSHAVRLQFITHKNPALWWRLSLVSARQGGSNQPSGYTNAQYNKGLRTATDALNALVMKDSDAKAAAGAAAKPKAPKPLAPNRSAMTELPYGTMPNEVAFIMSVMDAFESPFAFSMGLNRYDHAAVVLAAEKCDAQIRRDGTNVISITSPRDMYKIIQKLQEMNREFGDERAGDIAATMMGMAGFNCTDD